jgi:hypothetical protein
MSNFFYIHRKYHLTKKFPLIAHWVYTDDQTEVPQKKLKGFHSNGLAENTTIYKTLNSINNKLDILLFNKQLIFTFDNPCDVIKGNFLLLYNLVENSIFKKTNFNNYHKGLLKFKVSSL